MEWSSVDTADELKYLHRLVCWDDSGVIEIYAKAGHEPFFPDEINRSGHGALNYYLLCHGTSAKVGCLEVALVHCEWLSPSFLEQPFFQGRVDSLMRVEVWDHQKSTLMRCARLLYRVHDSDAGVRPGHLARSFASCDAT